MGPYARGAPGNCPSCPCVKTALYPTSDYDFVPNRQNRCELLRHFMTVEFVINFRTLGNMFLSSIYVTEGEMGPL